MYVTKDEAKRMRKGILDTVDAKFKDTNRFLAKLAEEDDWSFVIKSHALIEATITELITCVLGDVRIQPTLERLPLSEVQVGKLAFAKQLGVLDGRQIRFIRWYSELRNQLVHKVENVNFKFSEHWLQLDSNQRKSWRDTIDWARESEQPSVEFGGLVEKQTKTALRIAILILIAVCETHASQARTKRELQSASEKTTIEHMGQQDEVIRTQSELISDLTKIIEEMASYSPGGPPSEKKETPKPKKSSKRRSNPREKN